MPTTKARCMVTVSDEMFQAIEDFRYERRIASRSEAVQELVRIGLEELNKRKIYDTQGGLLSVAEEEIIYGYRKNKDMRPAVNKLLDVKEEK